MQIETNPKHRTFSITMPQTKQIQTAQGPVEYSRFGDPSGPNVLSLHGGMGGCDQSSLLAMSVLTNWQAFDIVAPARPGYLATKARHDQTLEEQADQLAALLDSLDLDTCTLMAISAGGPAAITFAARHPDRCARLILVSACAGTLPTQQRIFAILSMMQLAARSKAVVGWMKKKATSDPKKTARRSIPDPEMLERTFAHLEAGHLMSALQASIYNRMAERLPGTINDTRTFAEGLDLPFEAIASPTLIIHGKADRIVPFDHAIMAHQGISNSVLHSIETGDHVALFTHIDEIRQAVAEFMA